MAKIADYVLKEFRQANTLPKNFKLFSAGVLAFLMFLAVLVLEARRTFAIFDPAATEFFQAIMPRILDVPLSLLSLLGSFEITSFVVLLLALWVFRRQKKIFFSLVFFGMILVFEFIGKLGLYHPGPPKDFFRYTLPFSFPTSYVSTSSSFPSGHVSRTIFLAVVSTFLVGKFVKARGKLLRVVIFLYAAAMVVSRIYLGEHWASDTIGGLLLGGAMGLFAISYF